MERREEEQEGVDVREGAWEGAWEHADDQGMGCMCCEGAPGGGVAGAAVELFTSLLYYRRELRWVVW